MKSFKIDWSNHLVAFFSSLLGILIAFQLQNYAEERGQRQRIEIAMHSIKKEVENNLRIYQFNADSLANFNSYIEFYFTHALPGSHGLALTVAQFDSARHRFPSRMQNMKVIRHLNDSTALYQGIIVVDVSPKTGVSTSNWEAVRASGVINLFDQATAANLTEIYYWTDINLGQGDADFYRMLVTKGEIDDVMEVHDYYKSASNVARLKKQHIEKIVGQIDWH